MRRYAIVLGGGRSLRMGTNKMALQVGGESLLGRTVAAALTWADEVVIAAPQPDDWAVAPLVHFTLEDPPFGGPAAGIKASVAHLHDAGDADQILLLAGDLAHPDLTVTALSEAVDALEPNSVRGVAEPRKDVTAPWRSAAEAPDVPVGVILEDSQGWAQYLAGIYTLGSLRWALEQVESVRNLSARRLLGDLLLIRVSAGQEVTADLDTPEDLHGTLDLQPS